jgi:hypothetical protein
MEWYTHCKEVLNVNDLKSDRNGINKILLGEKLQMNDVWDYISTLEQYGRRVFTTPSLSKGFEGAADDLTEQLLLLLRRAIDNYQA